MNNSFTIVLSIMVIVALAISIVAVTDNTEQTVDPQVAVNKAVIDILKTDTENLKSDNEFLLQRATDLSQRISDVKDSSMNATHVANFNARLLQVEKALLTLKDNPVVVSVPQPNPDKTFNLSTQNAQSVPQDIFKINEVVYITGDAGATEKSTVSLKIRDSQGFELLKKDFAIAVEGKFTSIYQVPNLNAGIYTVTVSDGFIANSITFTVE